MTTRMVLLFSLLLSTVAHGYYDPAAGKWLSRDPIGEKGGPNLTAAFNGDPVNNVDPTGLTPEVGVRVGLCVGWDSESERFAFTGCEIVGSIQEDVSDSVNIKLDIGYRRYTKGLGVSRDGKGPYLDRWFSLSGTYGHEEGSESPVFTASPFHYSALNDAYDKSFTFGQTWNWHSHMKYTRIGHIQAKHGEGFLHYQNDSARLPSLGGGSDYSWTASLSFGQTLDDGEYWMVGWEAFTGKPRYKADGSYETITYDGANGERGYHDQTDSNLGFNRSEWFVSVGNSFGRMTFAEPVSPPSTWWNLQNPIHTLLTKSEPWFIYNADDDVQLRLSLGPLFSTGMKGVRCDE